MQQLVSEVLSRIERASSRLRRRRAVDQQRHEATVRALVSDLVHGTLLSPGQRIAVPMAKAALGTKTRQVPFMTEMFADTVRDVCHVDLGVADLQLGYKTQLGSQRSTVGAGQWLVNRAEELEVSPSDIGRDRTLAGDSLILNAPKVRGKQRRLLIPDTENVRELRREMEEINDWIAEADIEYIFCPIDDRIDTGNRYLRRVFSNGSLGQGGRLFHGFWIPMSEEKRLAGIVVDGEPLVSLDFAQMALRVAYGEVGVPAPAGDLYDVPGYAANRIGLKKVINALMASDGVPSRMPRGTRRYFSPRLKFDQIYRAICAHHPAVVPLFGTASSLRFMNTESRVIVKALLELKALGVVALPVHDCLLVGEGSEAIAKEVLEQSFRTITGTEGRVEVERKHLEGSCVSPLKKGA